MWWHVGSSSVWSLATSRFLAVALFRLYFIGREGTLGTVFWQTFAMYCRVSYYNLVQGINCEL